MMPKKVLWISRHAPLRKQLRVLQKRYGTDCRVMRSDLSNSREIAEEFRTGVYADIVCVVPLSTLDHICREGVTPLWAEMKEIGVGKSDLSYGGKRFWFTGFKRVTGVSLDLRSVPEMAGVIKILRVTKNTASPEEIAELQKLFGEHVTIQESPRPFRDGKEVHHRMLRAGAPEVLLVAPYSVYDQLTRMGIFPLYVKMKGGRFGSLHRIIGVNILSEEI